VLDKALVHALHVLRSSSLTQSECKAAMDELLQAFDSMKAKA
jgi:hypothetical protein